ncbi:hypothetical protein BBO99_00009681 [Phytophthora kernoviae]|uniref:FAD/NAD(P)-binding domain-containing protein n=2 Tax=Phytophthora kernoviae TaxID=325452 RepID=A0A3R7HC77_9STRA|nr:hypothetical protein G195_010344 [Phytophthora kernoviae 00238/432]KAG2502782.1 hypothetical protein JM16_009617 [Phytophthora kernoviae]KAG2503080.1 hypothetical protein JM18_009637 [Phytophthora kernoviae]RLN14223.1 hypothetical protein BBI17_009727 [Phytophthora kernoviae]RLN72802.1 hypothetical protein BBO99_00009681 [Phytophthora kernoviae]
MVRDLTTNDSTEVIIIEKSKFYYHAVGTPRTVVDANFTKKLFISYDNAISESAMPLIKFQRAMIVPGSVESMSYNYLVIATDGTYTVPFKQPANNFKRSTTEAKLTETVMTVEGKDKLAAGEHVREKFHKKLTKHLKRLDVKVVLGERLKTRLTSNSCEKQTLRTNKGTVIESDGQLLCGGFSPTTELV